MTSRRAPGTDTEVLRLMARRRHIHRLDPPRPLRSVAAAVAFVRERRLVMEAGRSSLPTLTEAIVGRTISGSWMADPEVHRIHDVAYGVDERHEFVAAPLILGKRVLAVANLGAAIERVASDPGRIAAARERISALALDLLKRLEERGATRADSWAKGADRARPVRLELLRELLVVSETIHTPEGLHAAIVRPWREGEIAARFARAAALLTYAAAQDELMRVALRSAVVAPKREAVRWFVFGAECIERLVAAGDVRVLSAQRTQWLALADATEERTSADSAR